MLQERWYPNAKVSVRNKATNIEWNVVSSDAGIYFIQNPPAGQYTITCVAPGFKEKIVEHVETEVDKVSSVGITLAVGTTNEMVTVAAQSGALLTTTSATVCTLVSQKEVGTLPLNGRSWVSLNFLNPGTATFHSNSDSFVNVTGSVSLGNFVVNGLRGYNILIVSAIPIFPAVLVKRLPNSLTRAVSSRRPYTPMAMQVATS
jgi:hypothetical protein